MTTPTQLQTEFRSRMQVSDDVAYFDHAAVSPLTSAAVEAINEWTADFASRGDMNWPHWRKRVEEVRLFGARLLNADSGEVAITHSTTEGVSFVSEGFDWQPGDNVVIPNNEFPSNLYPWMHLQDKGVEVRQVPVDKGIVDINRIIETCDENTRIVACSWVGYASGYRLDLDKLANAVHEQGALLFLDAIQGLGLFPLDVKQTPVDFLSADGHKWLLGPEGAGLFYCRAEHLPKLRPSCVGWNSVQNAGDFTKNEFLLKNTADRYEAGTYNTIGNLAFRASLQTFLEFGVDAISATLKTVTDEICRRVEAETEYRIASDRTDDHWSSIIAVDVGDADPVQVREKCISKNVVLSARGGCLRLAPHVYTSEKDITQLIAALQ